MKSLEADEITATSPRQADWGFWVRRLIGDGKTTYIDRLTILLTPWFSIKLHRIYRPDQQRELHDHPWTFLSIVLWGHYLEDTPHGPRRCWWWNWKRAEDSHSIRETSRTPVWTLLFTGPRRRIWGFYAKNGWVAWDQYDKLYNA